MCSEKDRIRVSHNYIERRKLWVDTKVRLIHQHLRVLNFMVFVLHVILNAVDLVPVHVVDRVRDRVKAAAWVTVKADVIRATHQGRLFDLR